jgi:hypothetical protein
MKKGWPALAAALWWQDSAPDAKERLAAIHATLQGRKAAKYQAAIDYLEHPPVRIAHNERPMRRPTLRKRLSLAIARMAKQWRGFGR